MPTPTPGVAPPSFVGPDLFNPPPHRGWITLTPSIAIDVEYNDNIGLRRDDETEDVLLSATPALTLSMQRPEYRLLAGYNFTAEYYADETDLNGVAKRMQFFTDAFYRFGPRLTFTLFDRFVFDRETNVVSASGIAAGRGESYRNTLTPRLRWQATPLTALHVMGSYTLQRFDADVDARDSDTYRASVGLDHQFTPRLTGTARVGVAFIEPEDDPSAVTYTPRVGFEYQFTPTLTGQISGGPSLIDREDDRDDDQRITPAVTAGLLQVFRFGSLQVGYDRAFTAETIGVTDRQTAFAALRLTTLRRGFEFEVVPRYTHADREREGDDRKIESFRVDLRASYLIARNISLVAAYALFHQTEDRREDIDQNRAFLGLRYAYPINFD